MVTCTEMAEIAMDYDTAMSCAMLRALGVSRTRPPRRRAKRPQQWRPDPYDGIAECFRNPSSPMDGR